MKITSENAKEVFAKLAEPFAPEDIEWRIGQANVRDKKVTSAKAFAYITRTAVQRRLDEVLGPHNWRVEYREWHPERQDNSVSQLCGISVKIDGEWITKWDGADETQMENVKGGISDALKRAATCWGIGRYLYDLEEGWVTIVTDKPERERRAAGAIYGKDAKTGTVFYWLPPRLPQWALPAEKASGPQKHRQAAEPPEEDSVPATTVPASNGAWRPREQPKRESPADRRARRTAPTENAPARTNDDEVVREELRGILERFELEGRPLEDYRTLYASVDKEPWSDATKQAAKQLINEAAQRAKAQVPA